MIEALALIFLWQRLPVQLCSLQQRQCTHHIGAGEGERILDRAIHMTLSCKMDDTVNLLILHQLIEGIEVADVHLHELVVRLILYILEVCKVTCIGQLIQIDNVVLRIFIHEKSYNMASYKTCATCDYYVSFHKVYIFGFPVRFTSSITLSRY